MVQFERRITARHGTAHVQKCMHVRVCVYCVLVGSGMSAWKNSQESKHCLNITSKCRIMHFYVMLNVMLYLIQHIVLRNMVRLYNFCGKSVGGYRI